MKGETNGEEMREESEVVKEETSSVEQVAMTVSTTDDPSLPVWTLRMWVLGLSSCIIMSFINQFFQYRSYPMKISSLSATLAALPLGQLMAALLPNKLVCIPFTTWSFPLNPGPFNVKEHVLIAMFANAGNAYGYGGAFAVEMVNLIKAFYKIKINFFVALLLLFSSQLMGYGWAGFMRKQLVDPAEMWWPSSMPQVSLFRILHEKDRAKKSRIQLSRDQFFYVVTIASFAYYVLPGYFMPLLSCISILCWIWPNSIIAQQIGSGNRGLGIGAFTFDWGAISSFLGSPLVFPWSTVVNIMVGTLIFMYIVMPIIYWNNVYNAKMFPFISTGLFTSNGGDYNISSALNYNHVSPSDMKQDDELRLSPFFALANGLWFAAPIATLTHVLLFHGKEIWQRFKRTGEGYMDVHTRLMRHNYPDIPALWFTMILVPSLVGALVISLGFQEQVRIPWWGVILGCGIAAIATLPSGIITATTNASPVLMVLMQFLGGYIFPGNPIANQGLKLYGHMTMQQSIYFLADFKLGHYMKIPPRSMFLVQVIGTIVAGTINMITAFWLLDSVPHICNIDGKLQQGSQWTCPWDVVAFRLSVVWGVVGPGKLFGAHGTYKNLIAYFILVGLLAPVLVWLLSKMFPKVSWIKEINMPLILIASGYLSAGGMINYLPWFVVGAVFNFFLYRFKKEWWSRYNYPLSAGLDAGTAIMGVLLSITLGFQNKSIAWWGTQQGLDQCRLATCPIDQTVNVKGCPKSF